MKINNQELKTLYLNNLWRFLLFSLFGILSGYLVSQKGAEGNNYFIIMFLFFTLLGLLLSLISVIKGRKKILKNKS